MNRLCLIWRIEEQKDRLAINRQDLEADPTVSFGGGFERLLLCRIASQDTNLQ